MERQSGRKKWIKRITVLFFAMMLFLTFFSNTIMNHSLAQVSTEQIVSDSVSAKVRGTGTVEAGDPVEIKVSESREVEEVLVKTGDEVKPGDVLIKLKEGVSTEREAAASELKELKEAYDNNIMINEIDNHIVSRAENGGIDKADATAKLSTLSATMKQVSEKVKNLQKQSDALSDGTSEQSAAVKKASKEAEEAGKELSQAQTSWESFGMEESEVRELYENDRTEQVEQAKAALDAYHEAKSRYEQKSQVKEELESQLEESRESITLELAKANEELTEATEAHDDYIAEINTVNSIKSQYEAIREKEKELEKLTQQSVGNEITAKVAGKVISVDIKKGEVAQAEIPLLTLQDEANGYSLSFSVTKEQAAKVKKGDTATVSDAWYFSDLTVTLSEIKVDPENPSRNKKLIFAIDGDVEVGQNLTVAVGEKSTRYDYVVPNNAVREDSNGKFILVIREKSSPLGNRYVATRVNVEVLLSDDSKSALKAAVEGSEYVITNANKMVKPGDYVRLAK